ncbi:MFS family permease [Arthrobacter sp. V4I6]|uniref:MFS transporter n=1 Tax=unclassified Arthrobacter TaxID=235627 RepID=UPI002785BB7C|nr:MULTISPECIES: MFS transporter [unclassified Arthrobacter]MDQ0822392.1 MFS family permease [Arthrobacter sp. V1I7]MDQ0852019.1 MFS family permease [Arthrobacter sp. V4I6]
MNVSTAAKPASAESLPPGIELSGTTSSSTETPALPPASRRRFLPVSGKRPGPVAVTLLFSLGWVFMYADRNILSPVMSVIQEQWGLNRGQLGLMSTVFFITYALMQIPTGYLADRIGRVKVVVAGYVVFGIGTILSGFAPGFMIFLLMRAFTGIGEGTFYSPVYGISSSYISDKWRGVSAALINSGMAVGISLGFIGSSYFTFTLGLEWHVTFLIFGAATLVVAFLINYFLAPIDAEHKAKAAADAEARLGSDAPAVKESSKALFTRNHILTYVLIFCSLYGFFSMLTWLPTYLQQARDVAPSQTGIIASLVPWASIPGAILLSMLARRLRNTRPLIVLLAVLGGLCQVLVPLTGDYSLMIVGLVVYGLVGKLALDPILIAFLAENTPRSMYSRAYGYFNFAGMLSSIFAPYITGALADATGALEAGFYLSAVLLLIGAIAFCFTKPAAVAAPEPALRPVG